MVKLTIETLNKIPLLNGLDEKLLSQLRDIIVLRKYARKEIVIHKGTIGESLLFLIIGQLQIVDVTKQGREIGFDFLHPGDFFGELALIDGLPRSASVVASQDAIVAYLPKNEALQLFYHHPLIVKRMMERFAAIHRKTSGRRMLLSASSADVRVYLMLNNLLEKADGKTIENLPTQQELASMVNTSRETVSRAIQKLVKKGVIDKDRRRIVLVKPSALKQLIAKND